MSSHPGPVRLRSFAEPRHAIPAHQREWLFDHGSLTRRLLAASNGNLRVQMIGQSWRFPTASERRAIAMPPRVLALVREVLLVCDDRPWVFARSVIPRAMLKAARGRLARPAQRPLGETLFAIPGMRRASMQIRRPASDPHTLARCTRALGVRPEGAWQRTSVFRWRGQPLLVNEIFLEAMLGG